MNSGSLHQKLLSGWSWPLLPYTGSSWFQSSSYSWIIVLDSWHLHHSKLFIRDELRQFAPTTIKWVILTLTSIHNVFMLPVFFTFRFVLLSFPLVTLIPQGVLLCNYPKHIYLTIFSEHWEMFVSAPFLLEFKNNFFREGNSVCCNLYFLKAKHSFETT